MAIIKNNEIEKTVMYLGRLASVPVPEWIVLDGKSIELWVFTRFIDMLDDDTAIIEINKTPKIELIKDVPENYSLKYYAAPIVRNVRLIPNMWNVYAEDLNEEHEIDWSDIFDDEAEDVEEFDLDMLE